MQYKYTHKNDPAQFALWLRLLFIGNDCHPGMASNVCQVFKLISMYLISQKSLALYIQSFWICPFSYI